MNFCQNCSNLGCDKTVGLTGLTSYIATCHCICHNSTVYPYISKESKPYKCPVCCGDGIRHIIGSIQKGQCHACEGKGIVWNK